MSYIGKNIKKIRKLKQLSQSQFAELFDLSRSNIGSYEEERAEPKLDILIKIANYFSLSVDVLISKEITLNDFTRFKTSVHEDLIRNNKTVVDYGKNIPLISASNYAEYFSNKRDEAYLSTLKHICLPLPENITMRAFQIKNDCFCSMMNKYSEEDILIGSWVSKRYYQEIPRNQAYIIVANDAVYCCPLHFENGNLLLTSLQKTIPIASILEIWTVIGYYSSNIRFGQHTTKLEELESRILSLEQKTK